MSSKKHRYKLNIETLSFELHESSLIKRCIKPLILLGVSFALFAFYIFHVTEKYEWKTPKSIQLEKDVSEWHSKLSMLDKNLEDINRKLLELEMRDNNVYRPIFGMEELSPDVRKGGVGGTDRYQALRNIDMSGVLISTTLKAEILSKRAYIQSKSYDEVELLSQRAEEMALCIPRISPVAMSPQYRLSDKYGMRIDPIDGKYRMHAGIDLAGPKGDPIYVTGNGVVESVGFDFYGYGNYVLVDHGFGYKTRYAHLTKANVRKGDSVSRGQIIGTLGSTGKSTGPHLHYEVIHINKTVNPLNYFNRNIKLEDYYALLGTTLDNQG